MIPILIVGAVLEEVYKSIEKSSLQIIMFDDQDPERLGLTPDESSDLLGEGKSGFNGLTNEEG